MLRLLSGEKKSRQLVAARFRKTICFIISKLLEIVKHFQQKTHTFVVVNLLALHELICRQIVALKQNMMQGNFYYACCNAKYKINLTMVMRNMHIAKKHAFNANL